MKIKYTAFAFLSLLVGFVVAASSHAEVEMSIARTLTLEETPLDTAGCLGLIERPAEPFLVLNGDLLTTLSYRNLMAAQGRNGAIATIAAYPRDVTIDLGVLKEQLHKRIFWQCAGDNRCKSQSMIKIHGNDACCCGMGQ